MTTENTVLLTGSKEDAAVLRWVQQATAGPNDNRERLSGICVNGGDLVVATDGYRLHAQPRPAALEGKTGIFRPAGAKTWPAGDKSGFYAPAEEVEGNFPDYSVIVPRGQAVAGRVIVSGRFLREFCDRLGDDSVEITIFSQANKDGYATGPIELRTAESGVHGASSRYATVMPKDNRGFNVYDPFTNHKTGN